MNQAWDCKVPRLFFIHFENPDDAIQFVSDTKEFLNTLLEDYSELFIPGLQDALNAAWNERVIQRFKELIDFISEVIEDVNEQRSAILKLQALTVYYRELIKTDSSLTDTIKNC